MEQQPLVSIITPVYNCETFLHETIESVLAQTYANWELWLINDASSDGSKYIAAQFAEADSRIKLIDLEKTAVQQWRVTKAWKGQKASMWLFWMAMICGGLRN